MPDSAAILIEGADIVFDDRVERASLRIEDGRIAAIDGARDGATIVDGRGHLLATVSMGGIVALPGSATYSAAKAGLRAFLWALHAELAGTGVKVSGIYPSGVDTAMLRHEARDGGSMLNFLGKVFTVDEVVRAYGRALDRGTLEVYLPVSDAISSRLSSFWPATANRLIPLLERVGRKGHAKYLARLKADEE